MALEPWPTPTSSTPDQYDRSSTPVDVAKKLRLLLPWFPGEGCSGSPGRQAANILISPTWVLRKLNSRCIQPRDQGLPSFIHSHSYSGGSTLGMASQDYWDPGHSAHLTQGRGSNQMQIRKTRGYHPAWCPPHKAWVSLPKSRLLSSLPCPELWYREAEIKGGTLLPTLQK